MKLVLSVLTMIFILSSCKNKTEKDTREQNIPTQQENIEAEDPKREKQNNATSNTKDSSELKYSKEQSNSENNSPTTLAGNYIKVGMENDVNCSCFCLDIKFNSNSELCLTPDKMYINVRFERISGNLINVYLVDPSKGNDEGDEIPWEKLDRTTPVAIITSKNNEEIDFDWLGFTINGDIALDYALFGKKTLEGTYKKK